MTDRVASDTDTVTTHRGRIDRVGSTRRRCIRPPSETLPDPESFVRVVIDRTEYHARIAHDGIGPYIGGAYRNRRLARTGEGENHLQTWLSEIDRGMDESIEFDVVLEGELYGLRRPGERTVYRVRQGPSDSLASIAEDLDGR